MRYLIARLTLLACTAPVLAESVALVIGKGNYAHTDTLRSAANDAADMAAILRGLGFRVAEGIDLPRRDAMQLVRRFSQSLNQVDTALFHFAGNATLPEATSSSCRWKPCLAAKPT